MCFHVGTEWPLLQSSAMGVEGASPISCRVGNREHICEWRITQRWVTERQSVSTGRMAYVFMQYRLNTNAFSAGTVATRSQRRRAPLFPH